MTNREKFKEVFGFDPSNNICVTPEEIRCPLDCDKCKYNDWWDREWKEGVGLNDRT